MRAGIGHFRIGIPGCEAELRASAMVSVDEHNVRIRILPLVE
jgi:hypothetical protein